MRQERDDKNDSVEGTLSFTEYGEGMAFVDVRTALCSARIAMQGAQLLEWIPAGREPVLWLSPRSRYAVGKSIRGGVPVCWPWFGPHESESSFPAHGFARTQAWEMTEAAILDNDSIRLGFRLTRAEAESRLWPHVAALDIRFTLGSSLRIELITRNDGAEPFVIGEALHTYFKVADVRSIRVLGLDGRDYNDTADGGKRKRQTGPVTVSGEVDRLYQGTEATCIIEDPMMKRRIRIDKRGSRSTVVWNPWIDKSIRLGDIEEDGHLGMLCVESANAGGDAVTIAPGQTHTLWARYSIENMA